MKRFFQFGHTVIETWLPDDLPLPACMEKFRCAPQAADAVYRADYSDQLLRDAAAVMAGARDVIARGNVTIARLPQGECRILSVGEGVMPYALYQELGGGAHRVLIDRAQKELLCMEVLFVSLFALEKQVLKKDALILHSAWICTDGRAILFSAPSGTGKSTQAALWETYRGAVTVNGDRSLLVREENGWRVFGWPVSGTSGVCENETMPIRAVVMLRQARVNEVRPLRGVGAVRRLMGQVTINMWNPDFQMKALDLLEHLVSGTAVCELGCDISAQAVECLDTYLTQF